MNENGLHVLTVHKCYLHKDIILINFYIFLHACNIDNKW